MIKWLGQKLFNRNSKRKSTVNNSKSEFLKQIRNRDKRLVKATKKERERRPKLIKLEMKIDSL